MAEKKINTVLYDIDQSSDTSDTQKATARANIGAQAELTAGENIEIDPDTNTISSTSAPQVQADWDEIDTTSASYIRNKPVLYSESHYPNNLLYQVDNYQFSAFEAARDGYGNLFHLIHRDCVYDFSQGASTQPLIGYHNDMTGFTGGLQTLFDLRLRIAINPNPGTDPQSTEPYTIIDFTVPEVTTFLSFRVTIGSSQSFTVKNTPSILGKNAHVQIHTFKGVATVYVLDPGLVDTGYIVDYGTSDWNASVYKNPPPTLCHYTVNDQDDTSGATQPPVGHFYATLEAKQDDSVNGVCQVYTGYRTSAFGKRFFVKIIVKPDMNTGTASWERHEIPVSNSFIAVYNQTTYYEIERAYNAGYQITAIHDDQEYPMTLFTTTTSDKKCFVFSGLNSRSWMPQDWSYPCVSELICIEDGFDILKPDYNKDEIGFQRALWNHNWKPLSPIIIFGTGTCQQVENVLNAGMVPVCKKTPSGGIDFYPLKSKDNSTGYEFSNSTASVHLDLNDNWS